MTDLRHGWTLTGLHHAARLAANTTLCRVPWRDRYDIAWSAAAEHLYTCEHPPQEHNLVTAGRAAILAEETAQIHHYGWTADTAGPGIGSAPRFAMHWEWAARSTPSPEDRIVEAIALDQIMKTLPPRQREALHALAVFDTYDAAAHAMAAKMSTLTSALSEGRRRVLALWHEGEAPSRLWCRDRRDGGTQARTARRAMTRLRQRTGRTRTIRAASDLIPVHEGARVGWLTVIEPRRPGMERILCRCDCGTERLFAVPNLRNGNTQSCGCPGGRRAAADRTRAAMAAAGLAGGRYPRTRDAAKAAARRAAADAAPPERTPR